MSARSWVVGFAALALAAGCDGGGASPPTGDVPSRDVPALDAPLDAGGSDVGAVDQGPNDVADVERSASATIGPAGGTVTLEGAALTVPAGALTAATQITLSRTAIPVPAAYRAYSPVYRATPEGLAFAQPATIALPFDGDARIASVFWSRAAGGGYDRVGGIPAGGVARAEIAHLSTGFVANGVDYTPPADRSCAVTRLVEGRRAVPSAVAVFFTAEDCQGVPITGLGSDGFEVREDDQTLSVEAQAQILQRPGLQVFALLTLDMSASTAGLLPQLVEGARAFVDRLHGEERLPVQIGIALFAGDRDLAEWQAPTLDTARLHARLDALATFEPGDRLSTNLHGAVIDGLARLRDAEDAFRARNAGGGLSTGYLVLFTDGRDTAGLRGATDARDAVRSGLERGDRVLAVGLRSADFDAAALQGLSTEVLVAPDRALLPREFGDHARRIAGLVESSYLLAYCSPRRAGADHRVEVRVRGATSTAVASWRFDATGFAPGCAQTTFACGSARCGGLGCGACDDRTSACDANARECVDNCALTGRCGGVTMTNALGYTQVCADTARATSCAGACRDLTRDASHCGACGRACAAGLGCWGGECLPPGPRPLGPPSTSAVTSQRPTLRWQLPTGSDGARVALCRNRGMSADCLAPFDVTGAQGRPTVALTPGTWFWRVTGLAGARVATTPGGVWQLRVGARSAATDTSWGTVADVNGDGYGDAVSQGSFAVHLGGAGGLATTPAAVLRNEEWPTPAGDLNGDGYADVASLFAGRLSVRVGGIAGLAPTAVTLTSGEWVGSWAVPAEAGDLNGDGYGDIVAARNAGRNTGFYVFYGSATPSSVPPVALTVPPPPSDVATPMIVGAGDVNGDGYADLVALFYTFERGTSRAHLYLGTPRGPSASPAAIPLPPDLYFGNAISAAGDVNGDGYADLVIGVRSTDRVLVYHGGAGGLTATPTTLLLPRTPSDVVTRPVGVGDVNSDGYGDVAVLALEGGRTPVYLFTGGARGLGATPTQLAFPPAARIGSAIVALGDVDGDGFDDFMVHGGGGATVFRGGRLMEPVVLP